MTMSARLKSHLNRAAQQGSSQPLAFEDPHSCLLSEHGANQ
jgi:hypothetical protein